MRYQKAVLFVVLVLCCPFSIWSKGQAMQVSVDEYLRDEGDFNAVIRDGTLVITDTAAGEDEYMFQMTRILELIKKYAGLAKIDPTAGDLGFTSILFAASPVDSENGPALGYTILVENEQWQPYFEQTLNAQFKQVEMIVINPESTRDIDLLQYGVDISTIQFEPNPFLEDFRRQTAK